MISQNDFAKLLYIAGYIQKAIGKPLQVNIPEYSEVEMETFRSVFYYWAKRYRILRKGTVVHLGETMSGKRTVVFYM